MIVKIAIMRVNTIAITATVRIICRGQYQRGVRDSEEPNEPF